MSSLPKTSDRHGYLGTIIYYRSRYGVGIIPTSRDCFTIPVCQTVYSAQWYEIKVFPGNSPCRILCTLRCAPIKFSLPVILV